LLALVVAPEHAREGVQQRRLAGSGQTAQQDPLARRDVEVESARRPGVPRGVSPAPPAGRDTGAGHTRFAPVRPAANLFSAPVAARPRTIAHPPIPASTAPEIVVELM